MCPHEYIAEGRKDGNGEAARLVDTVYQPQFDELARKVKRDREEALLPEDDIATNKDK
jgi:hypothetical protein